MRLSIGVLAAVCLAAQTEAPKAVANRILGEVTTKNPDTKELSVKTAAGDVYTVVFTDSTVFVRVPPGERDLSKATKIGSSDVDTGDRIIARGDILADQKRVPEAKQIIVMTKSDIAQKQERETAEWQKRGIAGAVASLDPAAKQIKITTRGREGNATVTVKATDSTGIRRYAPDSIKWADAKPSSIAEIKAGDQVRVLGNKNADGSEIAAEQIVYGSFRTIAGTVISVDPQKNEIRINDTQLKKPVAVELAPDTLTKRLPPMVAYMLARRLNPTFQVPAGTAARQGGPPGAAPSAGAPGGGPPGGGAPGGAAGGPAGQRSPGAAGSQGPGGFGGNSGGPRDIQQMIERLPSFSISELKPGDGLIVSSSEGADRTRINAISVLAGVEPILIASPRTFGEASGIANWNLEMSAPVQ
jgi:hypothetical protein